MPRKVVFDALVKLEYKCAIEFSKGFVGLSSLILPKVQSLQKFLTTLVVPVWEFQGGVHNFDAF